MNVYMRRAEHLKKDIMTLILTTLWTLKDVENTSFGHNFTLWVMMNKMLN